MRRIQTSKNKLFIKFRGPSNSECLVNSNLEKRKKLGKTIRKMKKKKRKQISDPNAEYNLDKILNFKEKKRSTRGNKARSRLVGSTESAR